MGKQGKQMKTIALVDDDSYIGDMLTEVLTKAGYACLRAYSGTEALLLFEKNRPDLILLDLMLPGLSGEEVLKKISGIPVIVVSAKGDVEDKVKLLLDGAADYVTKPFDCKELLARIEVQMRKENRGMVSETLNIGELRLDTAAHMLTVSEKDVPLTKTEYAILHILMQNKDHVIAKSVLLDRISEETLDCTDSSLKQHISNLRKKLREASASGKDYIEAVWGIGFRLLGD